MDHHATPPGAATAAATGRYPAGPLDALDAADAAFRLLAAGPQPLAVHASQLAEGLPDRPVPLDELRVLLLHPATSARARNRAVPRGTRSPARDTLPMSLRSVIFPGRQAGGQSRRTARPGAAADKPESPCPRSRRDWGPDSRQSAARSGAQ